MRALVDRRRAASVTSAVVVALALAGCGEDREGTVEQQGGTDTAGADTAGTSTTPTTETTPPGDEVGTIEVEETEFELNPPNPRVPKAGVVTIEVRNAGKATHALEVEGPTGEVETEPIAPGDTARLRADLNRPGRYTWYCPVADHEDRGMKGFILVAGGGAGDGPGSDGHGGY